jgi:hypothetical protein
LYKLLYEENRGVTQMKDRAMKLFGLFMTFTLIAVMVGACATIGQGSCSAETSSLEWATISVPNTDGKQLYPGSDIGPMAVTPNGGILFAAVNVGGSWSLLKSTNGGYTWKSAVATGTTEIVAVDISPKGNIYVATTGSVYRSKDNGNTFPVMDMSGVSGTIDSLDTGVNADNNDVVVVGTSIDVYLFDGSIGSGWAAQTVGYPVLAVALSTQYTTDEAIVAVVNSGTQTIVRTKFGVWGGIGDVVIPGASSYRACIGLPADYNTSAPSLFVGLSAPSNGGDVFRVFWDGSKMTYHDFNVSANGGSSNVNIWSMAVNGSSARATIVAGAEGITATDNGSILVFASSDGGNSWVPNTIANKQPTGESHATVVHAASVTYAGTCGEQSAVSSAETGGYTSWDQRGLIDTSIDAITDMAVSQGYFSDSTIYITTNNSGTGRTSLWRTITGGDRWERVFCSTLTGNPALCAFDMVRLSVDKVVVAQSGTTAIWLSTNGSTTFSNKSGAQPIGGAKLQERITVFALGSGGTFYAGGANGSVKVSGDFGVYWTNASSDSEIPASDTVVDLVVAGDDVYVGTSGGGVYMASGSTFSFVQKGTNMPGMPGDIVHVTPDSYGEGYIYAGINSNAATKGIWRCDLLDTEAEWERIGYTADGGRLGNISALACAADNGILYAIGSDIGWRCESPATTKKTPVFAEIKNGLGANDSVKSGLTVISGSNLLFAIGNEGANPVIWTSSDEIIKMKLIGPASGAIAGAIWEKGSNVGRAMVTLSWEEVTGTDLYEVQIAPDKDFATVLDNSYFVSGSRYTANQMIQANLWLGKTYYWRVRVNAPYMSQWTETRSFITPLGPKTYLPELLSPAAGQSDVSLRLVLAWNNSLAVTNYELILAENCEWANPVLNLVGDKKLGSDTAYPIPFDLKPSTNYCWKVRGVSDISDSLWSDTGTFTTTAMAAPVAAEDSGTPAWVWIIIAVSAVFIVSVIVLIVRTRRSD